MRLVGALAEELGRRNIASKARTFASDRLKEAGATALARSRISSEPLLRGDVAYRGEIHAGEHEADPRPRTFDAVSPGWPNVPWKGMWTSRTRPPF